VGYLIAAYVVVVGTLVAYGLWIQAQRRTLRRRDEGRRYGEPGTAARPDAGRDRSLRGG
jgi:hypothetical protein